jgi:hypothetical protein
MSVVYELNCIEQRLEELSFLQPENALHVKGFGRGIEKNHAIPEETLQFILQHSFFVFDGDDLESDSFTKFVACLIPFLQSHQRIIAFKYRNGMNRFRKSWQRTIRFRFEGRIPSLLEFVTIPPVGVETRKVDIFVVPIDPIDSRDFVFLGREALRVTRAKKILSFGGGEVVFNEYLAAPADIHWFLYDISRTSDGKRDEPALKGVTVKDNHLRTQEGGLWKFTPRTI